MFIVILVEDSSVESFNIKVAQNNISLKKPKSLGFVQSDILDTVPNLIIVQNIIPLHLYF